MINSLITCKKLNSLDLTNNPITTTSDYRQKVKFALPTLLILDGFGFDEQIGCDAVGNLTECSSSLTSDSSRDNGSLLSNRICDSNLINRSMCGHSSSQSIIESTASATEPPPTTTISTKRPSTAGKLNIGSNLYEKHFYMRKWYPSIKQNILAKKR